MMRVATHGENEVAGRADAAPDPSTSAPAVQPAAQAGDGQRVDGGDPGEPRSYLPEDPQRARKRRRRFRRLRHAVVFLVIVAVVLGGAGYATAYYQGWLGTSKPTSTCKPVKPLPDVPARLISLNVFNASPKLGIAQSVAAALRRRGFRIISTGDDATGATIKAPAQVRYGPIGAAIAQTVARQVPGATLQEDGRSDPSVDLVIGNTYKALSQVAPPAPGAFRLNVYNTTYRTGLAAKVATLLKARGFTIGKDSNDPEASFVTGVAVLRYGPDGADAVRRVALQLKGATLVKDKRSGTSVDLVLGAKYTGLVSVAAAKAKPVPKVTIKAAAGPGCSSG